MSGLALGRELSAAGRDFEVFEASARPGGVVRSTRDDSGLLEWGPQRLRLVPDVARLVEELDLGSRLLRADRGLPLWMYRRGSLREVPRSLLGLLRSDLLSLPGRLRVLGEPLRGRPPREGSVAEALRHSFGAEAYEACLGPLFGGLYASDPSDMRSVDSLVPLLERLGNPRSLLAAGLALRSAAPPAVSFRDGLAELTDALSHSLAPRIRLSHPVEGLERRTEGWTVTAAGRSYGPYDALVLTVPAADAARLLREPAPRQATRLAKLRYQRLAMVHLRAQGETLRGLGYQVAFGEDLHTRGATFNDALFGRDRIVTAFLGGSRLPSLVDWPDERIAAVAEREFRIVTGRHSAALAVSRPAVPSFDRTWAALDGLVLPDHLHVCSAWAGRPGIVGRLAQARRLAARLAS